MLSIVNNRHDIHFSHTSQNDTAQLKETLLKLHSGRKKLTTSNKQTWMLPKPKRTVDRNEKVFSLENLHFLHHQKNISPKFHQRDQTKRLCHFG